MPAKLPLATIHAVRDTCLCLHTQRAARMLARRFDLALQPAGLTNGQFSLMMVLSAGKSRPLHQISAFLGMDRTTLTAALKSLERRGLINVARDAKDRRRKHLTLTELGRHALAAALPIWRSEHDTLERERPQLDPDALRAQLRLLA